MKRPRGASRLVGGPSSPISASPLSRIADQEVAHAAGVAILRIERCRSFRQITQFGSECLELGDALLDRAPTGAQPRAPSSPTAPGRASTAPPCAPCAPL